MKMAINIVKASNAQMGRTSDLLFLLNQSRYVPSFKKRSKPSSNKGLFTPNAPLLIAQYHITLGVNWALASNR
jgi:hypothetical protein